MAGSRMFLVFSQAKTVDSEDFSFVSYHIGDELPEIQAELYLAR
jgi:hypothetical protein